MKGLMTALVVVLLLSCFLTTESKATGFGIYLPYSKETVDYGIFDTDSYNFGIGFVLDGTVAKNRVFGYRLAIGLEFFDHEYDALKYDSDYNHYDSRYSVSGMRIVFDHTFGFGILRTRVVRLWLGPSVRIGFIAGESDENDAVGITLGAGFTALGLNLNLGRFFTLGFEAGYHSRADLYFDDVYYYEGNGYNYYNNDSESSDSASSQNFIAKLSIIFRISDVFEQ